MKIRKFIFNRIVIIQLLIFIFVSPSYSSEKKGIGIADLEAADKVKVLNVSWYYTWKPYPIKGINDIEFIPMIWGGKRTVSEKEYIRNTYGKVRYLLFLNEPDRTDQANLSVEDAIELFSEVKDLADEISSPACAGGINKWCNDFLEIARKNGFKISFLAIHLYTPPDSKKFLEIIDKIYKRFKLPIWITEFAVADWEAKKFGRKNKYSEEEVLKFMQEILPELEKRDFIKRYAWFGSGKGCYKKEQIRPSCLFDKDGKLTKVGLYYVNFNHN